MSAGSSDRRGLSADEARELSTRILESTSADEARVSLTSGWRGNTRYAVNRITTAGEFERVQASLTVRFGKRQATITTNRFDDDALAEAVASAEEQARLAPENPEAMPELGPQTYAASDGYHDSTANLGPEARGEIAADGIQGATRAGGIDVAGFLDVTAGSASVASSAGLFAYHASTSATYSITARTADGTGSGWSGFGERNWAAADSSSAHSQAVEKALRSRQPRTLEPGRYPVVMAPEAVSDLVSRLAFSMGARRADEGRSAFSAEGGGTKLGQQIVDERVRIWSDPQGLGSAPYTGDGLPIEPMMWVEDGVLSNLSYSRFWAEKQGRKPTGGAGSLRMAGTDKSLEDLISETERGVFVTRLWYIRSTDPRTISYTGLTRDGTFWIEDGEIQYPINNYRWNDSPLSALSALEDMSRPFRVRASREVPAIRVGEFNFTSVSEAV
ncbi:MAG: TldD/PmbA family protein [Gemmatimonadota bacterium]